MNYWSIINNYCLFKLKLFKLISLPGCWFSCENRFTSFINYMLKPWEFTQQLRSVSVSLVQKNSCRSSKTEIHSKSQNQAFSTCFLIIMLQILLGLWNRVSNWYFLNAEPKSVTRKKYRIKKKTGSNQIHSSKLGEHDSRFRIGILRDSHMERTEARRYIKLEWGRNCRFSSLLGCLEYNAHIVTQQV